MYTVDSVNQSGLLPVSAIHQMYWEDCGNPDGKPVIFLHGGPGGGSSPATRGFFNPEKYRIIQIDQRGCGKSLPHACIEDNDTWKLVADIEALREHLGIDKWMVFGGSWGSTLSLAYAQTHPERVTELVLRGIFLFRQFESDWLFKRGGASQIFPEAWETFENFIPEAQRGDLIAAYNHLLFGKDVDATTKIQAARHWCEYEEKIVFLHPQIPQDNDPHALAISSMENHYFINQGWLQGERALLSNIGKIRHIPTVIVQGRYDICTPPQSAYDLKQAFPEADLRMVIGGHSAFDDEVNKGLVAATDEFASR